MKLNKKFQNISKNIKTIKSRGLFLRLGISHLLVLTITISIFSLVYLSSINIISRNIQQLQRMTLSQYKIFADTQLLGIMRLSKELAYNRDIRNLALQDEISYGDLSLRRYYVVNNLRVLKVTNTLIESIGLYDADSNTMISGEGTYKLSDWCKMEANIDVDEFEKNILQFNMDSDSKFVLLQRRGNEGDDIASQNDKKDGENNEKPLAYISVISKKDKREKNVLGIIILKSSFLSNSKISNDTSLSKDSSIFITDGYSNIVFSEDFNRSKEILKKVDFSINQEKIIVKNNFISDIITKESEVNGLFYVSSINLPEYSNQINIMRNLFVFCTLSSIILAVFIAFMVATRRQIKINNIFNLLGIKSPVHKDEYFCIQQAVTKIVEEKENMQEYINEQTNTIFTYKLEDLIQGNLDDDNAYVILNSMDSKFEEHSFCTILISFTNINDNEINSLISQKLSIKIPTQIIEEYVLRAFKIGQNETFRLITTEIETIIACVVSLNNENEIDYDQMVNIRNVFHEMNKEIIKNYGISLYIGISSANQGINKLSKAYTEAFDLLEYIQILGSRRIAFYDELKQNLSTDNVEVYESQDLYFLEAEQHFEVCIKMGDYKEAKLFINETFNNYLDGSRLPSIHILQFKILGFMNIFLNAIRTKSFEYNELKKIRAFSGILRCRTINDMKNELLKILDYTDELYDESFAAATSNAGENILNYIKEHFTDPNLNVNALSTFFKINISLLSRIIKNKTGTGPLEIIQRLRLEKAKSLLKNTSSLNKVAEEVGLLNDVALIRLFRKFENTTPGRYKDILSKNDNR